MWYNVGTQPVLILRLSYLRFSVECFARFTSFERPAWSTGILIPASFLCGIIAAIFIWRGGQKTKRTKEVEERLRLALAMDQGHEAFLQLPDASDPRNDDTAGATAPTLTVNHPIWSGRGQEKSMRDVDVDERMTVPSTLKQRK